MTTEISVFHTIADIRPQSGGTSRAVVDLTDALGKHASIQPVLVTQTLSGEPALPSLNPRVQRIVASTNMPCALKFGLPFRVAIQETVKMRGAMLIHNHGLWLPVNHWACRLAHQYKIALLIQPHGMLEPWARRHQGWKKILPWLLYQRPYLKLASALIASSNQEAKNLQSLGLRLPIAIIPNGVDVPVFADRAGKGSNTKTLLFLSRVHPIKGLINLVRAWAQVRPTDWKVIFAGPDENGHQREVEQEIHRQGLAEAFTFIGPVKDEEKWELYRSADLFVLPTFTENFGIVIAEALASGIPVITTKGAPWAELETHNCGWWVDIGVEPLAKALKEAIGLSTETRQEMGLRGSRLVEENYSWDKIGKEMLSVYEWVLRGGKPPSCVMLD